MNKFHVSLLLTISLYGCGEVVVFGHVVREGNKPAEVTPATPPPAQPPPNPIAATEPVNINMAATSAPPAATIATIKEPTKAPTIQIIKTVTLTVAPEIAEKTAKDARFNSKTLLDVIKAELLSRKVLDSTEAPTGPTLVVYIDNYDLHATTNFYIFGVKPHTGTLAGNLLLKDDQGETTPLSHVEAYSRISVPESGEDKNLLQPLYRDFAVTIANSISGTHIPTSAERDQPPR